MSWYNYTQIDGLPSLLQYAQTIAPIGQLILIVTFIVSFVYLKKFETLQAIPASLFVTTIIAIGLWLLQLLPSEYLYGMMLLLGITGIALLIRKEE